jgi:hypothetical protein
MQRKTIAVKPSKIKRENTSHKTMKGKELLKLTDWEVANFILPPVTTITLYEGELSIESLRSRLALIFQKNPWLTSRIVKGAGKKAIPNMIYTTDFDVELTLDQHIKVYDAEETTLSLDLPYGGIVESMLPIQCVRSNPATNADEVLFKVAVVPVSKSEGTAPLQSALSKDGFALVVSMNHTLGDGHTYYKLYNMLSEGAEIEAMNPVRVDGFEEAKTKVIGQPENALLSSAGLGLGIMASYLGAKLFKAAPQNVFVNEVDPLWAANEKKKAKEDGSVPFISTNDAFTSWFFRHMKSNLNLMVANFRGRKPSILNLDDSYVGNYEANVPYFPEDTETPALIRKSISTPTGEFKAKRAAEPPTKIPGFWKLLKNKTSIITNWATFYTDVALEDKEKNILQPKLHLPIMETNGIMTSVWNTAVVFRPRAGAFAVLMITKQFDANSLAQKKETEGVEAPLGKRIV